MSAQTLQIGIVGGAGRMGQRLLALAAQSPTCCVASVLQHRRPVPLPAGSASLHTSDVFAFVQACQVVVDFSAPAAIDAVLPACTRQQVPYLVASTALSDAQDAAVAKASVALPVLVAANLSVGIAVLAGLLRQAVAQLADFDVEIVEAHHRHKRDAPSGTALHLFEHAHAARTELRAETGRTGHTAARQPAEVGLHSVRGGDVAGEHHVMLLGDGERVELSHRSHDGHVFARGALRAARWLQQQPAGRYTMQDVLGMQR